MAILAILCLAMPAAASSSRPSSAKAPVLGFGLLDPFLGWISGWFSPAPASKAPAERKVFGVTLPGDTLDASKSSSETDRGAMIDPNG
ncbi:MAG: hypothetical protein ACJ75H_00515 [Thermoanaerobaculia bacterium]